MSQAASLEVQRDTVDWVARRGETPGYDVSYVDAEGNMVSVEVKGTTAARFVAVQITANEWQAAQRLGQNYTLVLVSGAESPTPKLAVIVDPVAFATSGPMSLESVSYRLVRTQVQSVGAWRIFVRAE